MRLRLKYKDEINPLDNCPPQNASASAMQAYRFVYDPIEDDSNFLPVGIKSPERKLDGVNAACKSFSLSFFASKGQAIKRFNSLKDKCRNIHKSIGNHLAEGSLTEKDGLSTPIQNNGHFSLFESDEADLSQKFAIIQSL